MTLKELLEQIENRKGFTYSMKTGNMIKYENGYVVSLPGHERRFDQKTFKMNDLQKYILDKISILLLDDTMYLGAWINDKDVVLDVSIWVKSEHMAKQLGKLYNQKAIWDISNSTEIVL